MNANIPQPHVNPAPPPAVTAVQQELLHRVLVSAMYGGLVQRPDGRWTLDGEDAPLLVVLAGSILDREDLIGFCKNDDGGRSSYATIAGIAVKQTWDLELTAEDGAS